MTTVHGAKVKRDIARGETERALFLALCRQHGIPEPVWEWKFALPRQYRADYAWPEVRLMLEVEGGLFVQGAHMRGAHALSDMEKYNLAATRGWLVLRTIPGRRGLHNLATIQLIKDAFRARIELPPVTGAMQRRLPIGDGT